MQLLKGKNIISPHCISQVKLWIRAVFHAFVNFIYPHVCPVCRIMIDRPCCLCAKCWTKVNFISAPFCPIMGIPLAYYTEKRVLGIEAISNPLPFSQLRSAVVHQGVARILVHLLKYKDRSDLAPMMASWMIRTGSDLIASSDFILAVPLHYFRLVSRTYNQSAELARLIAAYNNKPFLSGGLIRVRATRKQVRLSSQARQENLHNAFVISKGFERIIKGKNLLLIDYVYTTGATVISATNALKEGGAINVSVLTFSISLR